MKKEINIKWKGATLDPSGYGAANRDFIYALHNAGVNITIEPWNYEAEHYTFYGQLGVLVNQLKKKKINYDTIIHHYVPNDLSLKYEAGKKNIGFSAWETSRIPKHWAPQINKLFDLQLVPSEYNKKVYEQSGITIPIKVMPHCFNQNEFELAEPLELESSIKNRFKFLSVFQWISRKNPFSLLKAYYTGFYEQKDVILIIKSYGLNRSLEEKNRLAYLIETIKKELQLDPNKCPPVLFIGDLISRNELVSLYKACDCFALPTSSEGFGMPFAEACASGMPIVAPNYGGQTDFLRKPFAYLSKYQMTPVAHMSFPHYSGLTNWCEPNVIDFRNGMRHFYELSKSDPAWFTGCGDLAKDMVKEKLSYEVIGPKFKKIIEEV